MLKNAVDEQRPGTSTAESATPAFIVDPTNSSAPVPRPYTWADCFGLLQRLGFNPRRILDIGANRGNWTRAALSIFPQASFRMVEPQGWLRAHAEDLLTGKNDIKWITAGVSDREGQLPLTVTPDEVSSSFLPTAEQASSLGFKQVMVPMTTVDALVQREWGDAPDMVKIDAEGCDLKVLAGAASLFGHTEIFLVEAAVCAPGLDNHLAAVVSFMAGRGYKVIDITDLNRSPKFGVLWLVELVFLRKASPLLEKASSYV